MKKRILALLLCLTLCLSLCPMAAFAASDTDWYDADETEFTLADADDLFGFAALVNGGNTFAGKTVKLGADIDLGGAAWKPIGGLVSYPSVTFAGTFDGQNKTVSNFTVSEYGTYATAGLFGSTMGTIENVIVDNASIYSNHYAGGIVAYSSSSACEIINCTVKNSTIISEPGSTGSGYDDGDKVGGNMGYNGEAGTISGCTVSNVTLKAYRDVGGIVGYSVPSNVTDNTVSDITVYADQETNYYGDKAANVGAIVGRNDSGAAVPSSNTVSGSNTLAGPGDSIPLAFAVAKIGTEGYSSLAAAVAAAGSGDTIVLLADEVIEGNAGVTIPAGLSVTLDLNGHTLSNLVNEDKASQVIANKGSLTITDSSEAKTGKIVNAVDSSAHAGEWWGTEQYNYATNVITNSGTLTVNGGEIYETAAGSISYAIDNNSSAADAILIVNGGYIHKDSGTAVRQFANSTVKENSVTVNSGTVEGGYAGIWIQLPGSSGQAKKVALNVTGGTIKGEYAFYDYSYGDIFDEAAYNISGGVLDGYVWSYGANVDISGGEFKGEVDIEQTLPSEVSVTGGKFWEGVFCFGDNASEGFVSGGQFKEYEYEYEGTTYNSIDDAAETLPEGLRLVQDADGWWYVEEIPDACKIGEVSYKTLADAVAAAESGDVIEILVADTYKLPASLPDNASIKGTMDGVVFDCVGSGSICSIPNGASFENVKFLMGQQNYHGFQHAGTLNFEDCVFDGKFFSYGDMNFDGCEFNQSAEDYNMWAYGMDLIYTDCVFNGHGKFINVYNEGGNPYTVTFDGCTFNSDVLNKAAVNVKETNGSTLLNRTVVITDCTANGSFPEANADTASKTDALIIFDPLVQVDDRVAGGTEDGGEVKISLDSSDLYRTPKKDAAVWIGYTSYDSLQDAVDAAEDGDEIVVTADDQEAVADREITFVLSGDGAKTAQVEAGDGYKKSAGDNGAIVIKAIPEYTVTFEMNGHGTQVEAQTVREENKAVKPADPAEDGWTFGGWYADTDFSAAFDFDAVIDADTTVFAKWTENTMPPSPPYVITLGADSEWMKGSTEGLAITSNAPFAKFDGVEIDGSTIASTNYTAKEGSTKINLLPAFLETLRVGSHTIRIVSKDGSASTKFIVKAPTEQPCTVTFNMGGHGTAPANQKISKGSKATKPSVDPAAKGWTFDGWYADATFSAKFDFNAEITSNTTVYAKWTKNSSDPTSPETGDNSRIFLWTAALFVSGGAFVGTAVYGKKRKRVE